jgi:hypothetical protein
MTASASKHSPVLLLHGQKIFFRVGFNDLGITSALDAKLLTD